MPAYDPAPLLDFVPSFWKNYYENSDQIQRLWEALARLMDDEFAQAEQVNNASNPGTCPDFIYHTYLYRKLENWESYGIRHSHYRVNFKSTALQTVFYLGFWPDPAEVQVFVNGKEVDTSEDPYTVTFEQDSTQPGTNPSGARLIFEDPKPAGIPVTVLTDKAIYRYEVEVTSAGLMSISFPDVVDPDSLKVVISKLNMTSSFDVSASGFNWKNLTPSVTDSRIFRRGETYEILDTITNVSTYVTVPSDTTAVSVVIANPMTAKIFRTINLDVSKGKINLSGNTLSFSGQAFPVSLRIRAADAYGSEGMLPTRPSTTLRFNRSFDYPSQAVYFLGGRIDGGHEATGNDVTFERSFMEGVTVVVEGAIERPNDHASFRAVTTSVTDLINLSLTRPLYLTPTLTEIPEYPVLIFIDGVLQYPDMYTFISTSKIQLIAPVFSGTVVDVFYVDLEDPKAHLHVRETFIPDLPTSTFALEDYVAPSYNPMTTVDGVLLTDPDKVRFDSEGKHLNFYQRLPQGTIVKVRGAHRAYRYHHDVDVELVRADYLQNGIDQRAASMPAGWTVQLAWEDGFLITKGLIEADEQVEDAWFVNAYVDERTAYWNFGTLLNISRETSKEYVDVIKAVYSGNYMGSQPKTIENYACIILGSEYLDKASVISSITGNVVKTVDRDYELMPNIPARVEPGKQYPKYEAISQALRVLDDWDSFDALALIGDKFSDNYTFAQTLDTHRLSTLEGTLSTFYAETGRMEDLSVDFIAEEVWIGDLIAMYDAATPTVPAYGRITKVERHSIYADVPLGVITSGYGEGYYGQWVYGGGYSIIPIDRYKIWNRKTDQLDVEEHLDEALPENVPYLASVLHGLLSAFVFLVEIDWAAIEDGTALRDVIRFVDRTKPVDTAYIAYTKAYDGGLKEDVDGALVDSDPSWTVVPNYLFISTDVGGFIGINGQVSPNVGSFVGP